MPAQRKATAPKTEAKAALAETNGHHDHQVEIKGLKFVLPAEVPFAAMLAGRTLDRLADDDDRGQTWAMLDLAEAYVGNQIHKLDQLSAMEGTEVVSELLEKADELYGTDAGESSASSDS